MPPFIQPVQPVFQALRCQDTSSTHELKKTGNKIPPCLTLDTLKGADIQPPLPHLMCIFWWACQQGKYPHNILRHSTCFDLTRIILGCKNYCSPHNRQQGSQIKGKKMTNVCRQKYLHLRLFRQLQCLNALIVQKPHVKTDFLSADLLSDSAR